MASTIPATPTTMDLLTTEQLKKAWLNSESPAFGDPVLARVSLPFSQAFYPLGFPVVITTNAMEVLEVAERSWGRFNRLFSTQVINIQVCVSSSESSDCPPNPVCRMRGDLSMSIADGENFVVCDFPRRSAVVYVTEASLRYRGYFSYYFLESAAMASISNLYATAIHAGCVALNNKGVMLCGDSGAGKSSLSYACARAGWTYITDDASFLVHGSDGLVAGNCHQVRFRPSAESLFPEISGLAVMRRAGVGKPSVEFPVDSHISTSSTTHASHIIFLKRGVNEQELTIFPRAVARLFMEQTAACMPFNIDRKLAAIDRLIEKEVYELRYNDLDWAIARLTDLVSEGGK